MVVVVVSWALGLAILAEEWVVPWTDSLVPDDAHDAGHGVSGLFVISLLRCMFILFALSQDAHE